MCNAGIMAHPPGVSKDGYEIQFATNHLGHAMLIKALLPTLLKTAEEPGSDVRIVSITSTGWRGHPKGGVQFETLNTVQDHFPVLGKWVRYGQSKLANLVYAAELARRYPNMTCLSVHPGIFATELVGNLGTFDKAFVYVTAIGRVLPEEKGAHSQLYVAAGAKKEDLVNGGYYTPVGVLSNSTLDKVAKDEKFAKDLWEWTEEALEGF
jgi:NAD(P)-dependent dehydrogenase (short-subunit alcohol dehydrogenase family)